MESLMIAIAAIGAIVSSANGNYNDNYEAPENQSKHSEQNCSFMRQYRLQSLEIKIRRQEISELVQQVSEQRESSDYTFFSELLFGRLGQIDLMADKIKNHMFCPEFRDQRQLLDRELAKAKTAVLWLTKPEFKDSATKYEALLKTLSDVDKDLEAVPKKLEELPDNQWLTKLGARKVVSDCETLIGKIAHSCLGSQQDLDKAFIGLSELLFLKEKLEKSLEN